MTTGGTAGRVDLAQAISLRTPLASSFAITVTESIIRNISDALARGENVKFHGFGSFVLIDKCERIGRNPMTMVEVTIPPRRVVTFWPSQALRDRVNSGD